LHDDLDFAQAVADAAVEPMTMRESIDERAKADPLHVARQDEMPGDR
jgi:hypothetical protein